MTTRMTVPMTEVNDLLIGGEFVCYGHPMGTIVSVGQVPPKTLITVDMNADMGGGRQVFAVPQTEEMTLNCDLSITFDDEEQP